MLGPFTVAKGKSNCHQSWGIVSALCPGPVGQPYMNRNCGETVCSNEKKCSSQKR